YDHLGWLTGEQAADLYDLSKHIDSLKYEQRKPGDGYFITATKDGREVLKKDVPTNELENFIGKELAQKIIDGEGSKAIFEEVNDRSGHYWQVTTADDPEFNHAFAYDNEAEARAKEARINA